MGIRTMAINLSVLTFTENADIVPASGSDQVINTGFANTLGGDDRITGIGSRVGIFNEGTINTGFGNDTITGYSRRIGILNDFTTINTGAGNDTITGTGTGSDGLGFGIKNQGTINTGAGDDVITGTAFLDFGTGISNRSMINTGDGNDTITGTSSTNGQGIANFGIINTGDGNDIVNALTGSFGGTGTTLLENGSDVVKGFGSGRFNGGNGYDKLQFTTRGTYTVSRSGSTVSFSKVGVPGVVMNTTLFEQLIAGSRTYNFADLVNGQVITAGLLPF